LYTYNTPYFFYVGLVLKRVFDVLTKKICDKLREEALKKDMPVEELIVEILSKALNTPIDPAERAEFHFKLAEKFLSEAEAFLSKGDYVEASEKAWGAAAQIVKALATREGREIRSHSGLWVYVNDLVKKTQDPELRRLWWAANLLHQNFYENFMTTEDVTLAVEDVKRFVEKLKKLI
jgi:uncharacterized protein (UPF0332 family)